MAIKRKSLRASLFIGVIITIIFVSFDNKSEPLETSLTQWYTPLLTTLEYMQTIPFEELSLSQTKVEEIQYQVPQHTDNSFKAYMDYRTITDVSSSQWQLQQQAYTDTNGLRKIDNYYCVALGTYYTNQIGDKFRIELKTGKTIDVIVADIKSDIHTNDTNQYIELNGKINIIEFIVDTYSLPTLARVMGDISYVEDGAFLGQVINIVELKEVD